MSSELLKLKNIGPKSAVWLEEIGVQNRQDIVDRGVVRVYQQLKMRRPEQITTVALYVLEGAVTDVHWNLIGEGRKEELKELALLAS